MVASACDARRFTVETLVSWGENHLVDPAALVVTELVTNAIVHASSAVRLILERLDSQGSIRIGVYDDSAEPPLLVAPSPFDCSGRGVALIAALAGRWGVETTAYGKNVWCELSPDRTGRIWEGEAMPAALAAGAVPAFSHTPPPARCAADGVLPH
jgi:hypothetical protein